MKDQTLDTAAPFRSGSFDGRVAVITGGSQGLGLATAELMKARGAEGLLLVGRDRVKGERSAESLDGDGCTVGFVSADIGTDAGVASIITATDDAFGRVDSFVNCAAATWRGSIWNTTGSMWDEMLRINVTGPAMLISGMAKIMKREAISGSIVVVGSIAHHGGVPELHPYIASKKALESVVRHAAFSLRSERIKVNILNPGWMDTPAEHEIQKRFHGAGEDWLDEVEATMPFGRLLDPAEVARGICFLASDESGMMTGASIDFDQTVPGHGAAPPAEPVPDHYDWEVS